MTFHSVGNVDINFKGQHGSMVQSSGLGWHPVAQGPPACMTPKVQGCPHCPPAHTSHRTDYDVCLLVHVFRLSVLFKFYISGILPYVSIICFPELDINFLSK